MKLGATGPSGGGFGASVDEVLESEPPVGGASVEGVEPAGLCGTVDEVNEWAVVGSDPVGAEQAAAAMLIAPTNTKSFDGRFMTGNLPSNGEYGTYPGDC